MPVQVTGYKAIAAYLGNSTRLRQRPLLISPRRTPTKTKSRDFELFKEAISSRWDKGGNGGMNWISGSTSSTPPEMPSATYNHL